MRSETVLIEKRSPVFGILSVTSPFAGIALALIADRLVRVLYPGDTGRFFALSYVALPVYAGLMGGMILAGVATVRNEKWPLLQWVGYLLSALPILYAIFGSR